MREIRASTEYMGCYPTKVDGVSLFWRGESGFDGRMTGGVAVISDSAHQHIAGHCGIPWRYYARMLQADGMLLCRNVNHWFQAEATDRVLQIEGNALVGFIGPRRAASLPDGVHASPLGHKMTVKDGKVVSIKIISPGSGWKPD